MNFARRKFRVAVVAAVAASLLLTLLSGMTFAQKTECTLPDCDQAKAFFSKFQKAIEANQKQEVVAMVRYPLRSAYPDGKAAVFKTKSQLLAEYDRVFTPAVRCAIQSATLSEVWGNWRGFTTSAGAIWWDRDIPGSATNVQMSDLSKYPFGVFSVNHSPVSDGTCPASQDVPVQP